MRKKLGRNDPCWCGSGLKYKKCHMDREKQEPLKLWEADKKLRKAFSTKECLAPEPMKAECSKIFVKAHTVPKSGSLQQIARNGHVYSYIQSLGIPTKYESRLQPQLVGINKASTFAGFCSVHDNTIFSKVENQSFVASQEQCFLLAYRALARELYTKKSQESLSNVRRQADKGKSLGQQFSIQAMNFWFDRGVSAGLRDIEYDKAIYDKVLLSGDFSGVRAYIIELEYPPPIMCSAGVFPEQDFEGNQLQDLADLKVPSHLLNFTSFYGGDCGAIVFTWLQENDPTCLRFISTLKALPPDRITDGLIRFFFEFCENLHINPEWWENLGDKKREALNDRMAASISMNLELDRKSGCIAEDGMEFDNWPISDLKTIGF